MDPKFIHAAIEIAQSVHWITIASADKDGQPHIAAARNMEFLSGRTVEITEWFCPVTMKNVSTNPLVAITVWDPNSDMGFQLRGRVSEVVDRAMMDGYMSHEEEAQILPQVQRQLQVEVTDVLRFTHAQHNDQPL